MESSERIGVHFQETSTQGNIVVDHQRTMNELKQENGQVDHNSDSFIVDLQGLTNGNLGQESVNNSPRSSRITLQRSLSRKGPQRGAERKTNDRDPLAPSSSPRAAQGMISMPEKSLSPPTLQMGSPDNQLPQHQITINTGGANTMPDGRWVKRSSFKRSPPAWFTNPKRILLFFATLSSMGTILLIYFTLAMNKPVETEGGLEWQ